MRKTLRRRLAAAGLLFCVTATTVTGCGVGNVEVVWSQNLSSKTVFKIGSKSCELCEAKIFLASYKALYEDIYGSKVWTQSHNGTTMEEYVKSVTITELAKMKSLDLLAEQQGEALTEQEIKTASKIASQYYDSLTKAEREYIGADKKDVEELCKEYALALKLYTKLTGGVKEEVSDDDARVMKVRQIVVSDEESAKAVEKRLNQGEEFATLASYYNKSYSVDTILYKQKMSEEMAEALAKLGEGDISACIKENDKFYFFEVVSKIDRELTEENKLVIVKERAAKAFDDVYNSFVNQLSSSYNENVWEEFHFDNDLKLSKVSFFELLKNQMGYSDM